MDKSQIAIVIPAYNEAATIADVVRSVSSFGMPIVVDDGSDDLTSDSAIKAGAHVLKRSKNGGYDTALNTGFEFASQASYEYVITFDADGQHTSNLIPNFLKALKGGADLVVGIRDHQQRIAEYIFSFVSRSFWGISDPLCGMKAYRISLYRELGHFDSYSSIGTELAIFAARNKKNIQQIPIATCNRADSPRFGSIFKGNIKILQALLRAFGHQ